SEVRDLTWLRTDGEQMSDEEWEAGWHRALGVRLGGDALGEVDENGDLLVDDTLLLLFNAHVEPVRFRLPGDDGDEWEVLVDTSCAGFDTGVQHAAAGTVLLTDRSMLVLCLRAGDAGASPE